MEIAHVYIMQLVRLVSETEYTVPLSLNCTNHTLTRSHFANVCKFNEVALLVKTAANQLLVNTVI